MKQIKIGNKFYAGAIALGAMRMAGKSDSEADRIVKTCVDRGVNFFDHADIYGGGESEAVFGRVLGLNPGLREKLFIQGKVGICKGFYDASYKHIMEAAEGCLNRLGIECFDTLLLHRPDALMQPEEVAEAFSRLEEQGKAKYFGVSNENAVQLQLLDKFLPGKIIINQLQFSLCHTILVDEGVNVNIHSPHAQVLSGGVLDYCRLKDITVQAWSPFQYGMFEGAFIDNEKFAGLNDALNDVAQKYGVTKSAIAVAWILRHPANIQPIVGSMNPERLKDILAGGDIELTREEWYKLYLAAGNPLP